MNNAFLSDPNWSPYINPSVQGFSLKQNNKEIRLQNLQEDLEMNIPVDLTSVSNSYSEDFTANTIKMHRYQVPSGAPYKRLIVHVKPENGQPLQVNFSVNFAASSFLYKLRFPAPFEEDEIPAPFSKVDNYSYIARELPSRPIYFNLNITVTEPFADQEGPENKSRAMHVNYTVAIYSVQCMYWDRKKYEWLDTGCKVRKLFLLVYATGSAPLYNSDLISERDAICRLTCRFSSLLRGFFAGFSGFLPPQKPTF